jgi:hypothetical protein
MLNERRTTIHAREANVNGRASTYFEEEDEDEEEESVVPVD